MLTKYNFKTKTAKKKRRVDWKKRVILILTIMLIANFAWDAYNRIPEVQHYTKTLLKIKD